MPKLPALKPREVEIMLEKAGFLYIRQKGSHRIFGKENLLVIVPYHTKDLRRGTLGSIIKQSGMSPEEFISLRKN